MAKKHQPTKQRRTIIIEEITSLLREMVKQHDTVEYYAKFGKNDKPDSNNIVTSSPNRTATITITIKVNGGAEDHELQPDWMAPGYLDRH